MSIIAILLALGAVQGGASAAREPAQCLAMDADLPDALAAWSVRSSATGDRLDIGRSYDVALKRDDTITYGIEPGRKRAPDGHGALLHFNVARTGTVRVALGARAWIDVVRDGQAVASTAHGHGPACSTIRKIVSFTLEPGAYQLQLSGSEKPVIAVLIASGD